MGNVNMEARQIHFRGGNKPMSVEEAIKEAGSGASLPDYSTEEQATGQKWIDGKDIYFITLSTPIQISANDQWIDTGLNGIDSLIDYTIRLTREDEQVGSGFNSGYIDVVVRNNTLNVKGHNFTITDLYAISSMTVYYTKNA